MGETNHAYAVDSYEDKLSAIDNLEFTSVDHMTHINNLGSILSHGLLSHNNPYKEVDISNMEVNERRNRIEPIYHRNLHDYVPLYFNPRNAMMFRNQKMFGEGIIVLGFDKKLIMANDAIFTNRNAACNGTLYSNDIIHSLPALDWRSVWSRAWYQDSELKKIMMAEVLVYEKVDIANLEVIFCQTPEIESYIRSNYDLGDIRIEVTDWVFF